MEEPLSRKYFEDRPDREPSPRVGTIRRCAVLAACLLTAVSASAATFTTSLDRDSVLVGETVTLTMRFEGGAPRGMPALPRMPGLQVAPGVSTGVQSSLGPDGKMTSVHTYALNLIAQQAGELVIPALTAEVDGERLNSQPLKLKVLQSDPSSPPPDLATNLAFLWLALPKQEMFVGEIVAAELRLYLRSEVGDISNLQIPPFTGEGFNAGGYVKGQQYQRRVAGATFTVVPLLFTLSPVKSGRLTVGPLEGSVLLLGGQRDFFGNYRQRVQAALNVPAQTVPALPLPAANAPSNFNGAVGSFAMTVTAGPTNLAAGDPITVRVQIAGRGAFQALTLPEQAAWQDFKTYPPTANVETSDVLGLQGRKVFEQIVSPQTADLKELPAFSFSYFDPDAKTYRTLTHPAIPLIVRPGGAAPLPVVAAGKNADVAQPPPQDIVPIKQRPGTLAHVTVPLVQQPWFLALQTVPALAWLAALLWRRRTDALANNPRLRRQRQVTQAVREGVRQLRQQAEANRSEDFFATLFRLLQEQIGERLDLPASSITEAVVDERLHPAGLPAAACATLHELFQTCNLARYAPVKSSQELAAFVPRVEQVIVELQRLRPV